MTVTFEKTTLMEDVRLGTFKCRNQNGIISYNSHYFFIDEKNVLSSFLNISKNIDHQFYPTNNSVISYDVPDGVIIITNSSDDRSVLAVEIKDGSYIRQITNLDEINLWLSEQPGHFSFDTQSKDLLKNNIRYSIKNSYFSGQFVGKLKSGHNITEYEGVKILDSNGNVELQIDYPWLNPEDTRFYCYGIGPWGEIYYLINPKVIREDDKFHAKEGDYAELVVVRNHLKYFGILTDDRIRLRKEASTSSESLGTYPKNTGFYIIERGTKEETIGTDKGIWYHVRLLDGKKGWFFGAYVRDLYEGPGTPLPWPNVADWD